MQILPTQKLFGLPALALRDFFLAYRTGNAWGFTYREFADHFGLKAAQAKAPLHPMAGEAYLEPPKVAKGVWTFGLHGNRLSLAKAVNKIPRAQADALLSLVLDRVLEVSRHPRFALEVSRLWVFGSYARGAEEVSDLDLVVELRWKTHEGDRVALLKRALKWFKEDGYAAYHWTAFDCATNARVHRFLKQRSLYISVMREPPEGDTSPLLLLYESLNGRQLLQDD